MKKQITAVEWLFEQLPDHLRLTKNGFDILQQAKEMEKQQINDAWKNGYFERDSNGAIYESVDWERYYNETFNNQNKIK